MKLKRLFTGMLLGVAGLSFGQFDKLPATDYMPAIFLNPAVAQDMHMSKEVVTQEQQVFIQKGMALIPFLSAQKGTITVAKQKQLTAQMMKAFGEMEDASLKPLNSSQRVRYHQLSLQYFGPMALAQTKQMNALGLSASQRTRLTSMLTSSTQAMGSHLKSLQGSASSDPRGAMSAVQKSQSETRSVQEAGLKKILTPAQLAKWNAMQGKKLPNITNLFGGMGI